ncbi:hypothetical protein DCS_00313 [Drechmeria coniospora]|uniref:Uncharacterized protein n=1 Tax=Drechmeria coniospora TaxID=98403 RepID=A0A151GQ14_DRECN|nr:hypothetical protein DCS_00313 [Drechmeria coniospora]KYK59183.1 hypothetical protein DCS_00313 [Drechmeria coniospora]
MYGGHITGSSTPYSVGTGLILLCTAPHQSLPPYYLLSNHPTSNHQPPFANNPSASRRATSQASLLVDITSVLQPSKVPQAAVLRDVALLTRVPTQGPFSLTRPSSAAVKVDHHEQSLLLLPSSPLPPSSSLSPSSRPNPTSSSLRPTSLPPSPPSGARAVCATQPPHLLHRWIRRLSFDCLARLSANALLSQSLYSVAFIITHRAPTFCVLPHRLRRELLSMTRGVEPRPTDPPAVVRIINDPPFAPRLRIPPGYLDVL